MTNYYHMIWNNYIPILDQCCQICNQIPFFGPILRFIIYFIIYIDYWIIVKPIIGFCLLVGPKIPFLNMWGGSEFPIICSYLSSYPSLYWVDHFEECVFLINSKFEYMLMFIRSLLLLILFYKTMYFLIDHNIVKPYQHKKEIELLQIRAKILCEYLEKYDRNKNLILLNEIDKIGITY